MKKKLFFVTAVNTEDDKDVITVDPVLISAETEEKARNQFVLKHSDELGKHSDTLEVVSSSFC